MRCLVCNGWAAGPEAWDLCTFPHDWLFNYIEQLDGLPERVMDGFDSVVLVGFSLGGATALRLFLRQPEKVRGLVLVSATPRMMEDKASGWKGMSRHRRAALKLGTQMAFAADPSPLYAEPAMDRGLDYLETTDLRPALEALPADVRRVPTAIFQSERDFIVYPHNADYLKGMFPSADVTWVPGSEHSLPVTIPEKIDAAVCRMLEEEKA